MKSRIRILVMTSSTGAGHDARARSFQEWVRVLYGDEVDVRVDQMLERSSVILRAGVDLYNAIHRRSPWVHHAFYALVELLGLINAGGTRLGRVYYLRVLRNYRPHLVLSVHDCLNRGYFALAKRELGRAVRCATFCSEFAGGYGFSRNWVDRHVDVFYARTPTAGDYAVKLGLPRERVRIGGMFLHPRAVRDVLDATTRGEHRRSLGLHPEKFTLLLTTGGAGANNHLEAAEHLEPLAGIMQAVFVCGRNEETRRALLERQSSGLRLRCSVLGYTDAMHRHIQAADAIFTRGGSSTAAKALHFLCPILFNAIGGVMPQERLTLKFFLRGGGASEVSSPLELAQVAGHWASDPTVGLQIRRNLMRLRRDEDPAVVVRELVELGAEAAGLPRSEEPVFAA